MERRTSTRATFNSRFEDELLNRELFSSLTEAKVLVEAYRLSYNNHRPHSSLGYRTPTEFAGGWPLGTLVIETSALRRQDLVVTSRHSHDPWYRKRGHANPEP